MRRDRPAHVTLKLVAGLPRLRRKYVFRALCECIRRAQKNSFAVVEFSIQENHLHLLCEADDTKAFSAGVRGLCVRIARSLNRLWERSGRVIGDRYHARILRTPLEVKNALAYVLNNARRHAWQHGRKMFAKNWVDQFSSAPSFEGFAGHRDVHSTHAVTSKPRTWLLKVGWQRYGPIELARIPGT
jgi:REP element-mobilizing transposase RayT